MTDNRMGERKKTKQTKSNGPKKTKKNKAKNHRKQQYIELLEHH
jgi:hypothetical protein